MVSLMVDFTQWLTGYAVEHERNVCYIYNIYALFQFNLYWISYNDFSSDKDFQT